MPRKKKCANPDNLHVAEVPADYSGSFEVYAGYYKQGDDFADCLEESKGNPIAALNLWAERLEGGAKILRELAEKLTGQKIEVDGADTHVVMISGRGKKAQAALRAAAESKLLSFSDYNECAGGKGWEYVGPDLEEEEAASLGGY